MFRLPFQKLPKTPEITKNNQSKSLEKLEMDLFCQLSYMAAIATSGIDRGGLFSYASKLPYLSASYFKKVVFVAKAFNHDYAEACNIVGQSTEEPIVEELLLRLSGALSSGENLADFLERESMVFSETYGNSYERKLESLAKWTDAYIALIMTTAIVTVMAVVTLMIGNATVGFIISLSVITIVVTLAGSWFIYSSTPKETKTHSLPHGSREQEIAKTMAKFILPAGGVAVLLTLLSHAGLGWALVIGGAFGLPVGIMGKLDDIKIDRRDSDVSGLLRSLGSISQATGVTVNEAMSRLDFRSIGSLSNEVSLLFTRLQARIDPALCWNRFVCDTGSEQVNRSIRIFWDSVALGGEPQRTGNAASNFAMKIALLRAKRSMIGTGFLWLSLTMHLVLTGLLVFVYETMITFSKLILKITPDKSTLQYAPNIPMIGMFSSNADQMGLLYFMIIVIILVLTVANAFSGYAVSGGHIFNLILFLSIALITAGAALVAIPPIVNMLFLNMG